MKRAIMKLFCLAAFAVFLTSAVCCAVNMHTTWANCAACSITPSTGGQLALLDALYPEIEWTAYGQDDASLPVANDALPPAARRYRRFAFSAIPAASPPFPLSPDGCPAKGRAARARWT